MASYWTDERIATARRMWGDGFSASDIAFSLDCGLTRNAVVGMVFRGRWERGGQRPAIRPRPPQPAWAAPAPRPAAPATPLPVMPPASATPPAAARPAAQPKAAPAGPVTIFELDNLFQMCREVVAQNGAGGLWCGHPVVPGSVWCAKHRAANVSAVERRRVFPAARRK